MNLSLKRSMSVLLAAAMALSLAGAVPLTAAASTGTSTEGAAADGVVTLVFTIDSNSYLVNGAFTTMDVSPVILEDRTLLPVRFVAEPLGAAVDWDEFTEKVTVRLMDTKLELWIGQNNAMVNGKLTAIDPGNPNVKPVTLNDRTMLPIRFVTENLGCDVAWEEATQRVTITKAPGGGTGGVTGDGTGGADGLDGLDGSVDTTPPAAAGEAEESDPAAGDDADGDNESDLPPPPPAPDEAAKPIDRDGLFASNFSSGLTFVKAYEPVIDLNSSILETLSGYEAAPADKAPKSPSNLVIVSNSEQPAPKLTWKDNATDEIDYSIHRHVKAGPSEPDIDITLPKNSTSYVDNSAKPGTLYWYVVTCRNAAGRSNYTQHPDCSGYCKAYVKGEGNVASASTTVNKGLSYLGRGYNIFGDYAVPDTSKGLKEPVLDYSKMVDCREIKKMEPSNKDSLFENIQRSAYDYCKTSTTSVKVGGGAMGFSASVSTNFGSMNSSSKNKYLATQTKWVKLYEYSLANPIYFDYSNFLLPSVQMALNDTSVSPAKILDTYGTHVMTSVWIGGRMDYNCSVESQSSESFSSFEMNVKASYSVGFAGGSASVGTATSESVKRFNSTTNRNVIFYGGTGSTGKIMNPNQAADAMDAWRNSLDASPTFTDFGGQDLKPIWELCSTKARSDAIKAEFDKRANTQKGLFPLPKYVTGLNIPTQNIGPANYTSTSIDINPLGCHFYLFYLLGENVNYALTDIFAVYRGDQNFPNYQLNASAATPWYVTHNSSKAANYIRSSPNLRIGAKAKHGSIMLFSTRDKIKQPIKVIEVVKCKDRNALNSIIENEPGWEYVTLLNEIEPFDFRKNQGGDFIAIRFMRE